MTTSGTKFRSGFSPLMAGVHVAPFPDPTHFGWPVEQATDFALAQLDYVLQTLSAPADTAAFFVEPVLGEGGYVPANERFLAGLRQRADELRHPAGGRRGADRRSAGPESSGAVTISTPGPTSWLPRRGWRPASRCRRSPHRRR